MNLTEFLEERIAEEAAMAQAAIDDDSGQDGGFEDKFNELTRPPSGVGFAQGGFGDACARMIVWNTPRRVLAECEAKRRIIEWHQSWPVLAEKPPEWEVPAGHDDLSSMTFRMSQEIAWMTQREYVARFGDQPPTAPILKFLAVPYKDHPDFNPAWS